MSTCLTCPNDVSTRRICATCQARMRHRLTDIVEFYALAEHEIAPGTTTARTTGTERSIGVRIIALDFLAGHDVVAVLDSWHRDWRDTYGLADPKAGPDVQATLVRIVSFLLAWLEQACTDHPAIEEFAHELAQSWNTARSAARMAPASRVVVECPTIDTDGQPCTGKISLDDQDQTYCRQCRTTRNLDLLLAITGADNAAPVWVDGEAAAKQSRIPERTLRRWASRGWITRSHGRYDLRSIETFIQTRRVPEGA